MGDVIKTNTTFKLSINRHIKPGNYNLRLYKVNGKVKQTFTLQVLEDPSIKQESVEEKDAQSLAKEERRQSRSRWETSLLPFRRDQRVVFYDAGEKKRRTAVVVGYTKENFPHRYSPDHCSSGHCSDKQFLIDYNVCVTLWHTDPSHCNDATDTNCFWMKDCKAGKHETKSTCTEGHSWIHYTYVKTCDDDT